MHKFFHRLLVVSITVVSLMVPEFRASFAAPGVAATEVRYPDNPYVGRTDIFISSNGVHAYASGNLKKQWTALRGEHTYEPVAYDNVLLVGSSRGLYALRTGDGSVLWHVEPGNEIFAPVIVDGIAYAGSRNGTLYAFDTINGTEKWRNHFPGWIYSPAFDGNTLITGGQDARLWALDPLSGKRLWTRELPGELVFRTVPGAPMTVLATTFAADLIAFDTSSGLQRWRLQTPTANMMPSVFDKRILLAGLDGGMRQVDLDSGTIDWETQLHGRLSSPRLIGNDHVLVSNDDGDVFFLNGLTGVTISVARIDGEAVGAPFIRQGSVFQFFQKSGQLSIVATTDISVN